MEFFRHTVAGRPNRPDLDTQIWSFSTNLHLQKLDQIEIERVCPSQESCCGPFLSLVLLTPSPTGFRIPDSVFRILDSGFWILDSGFWILDSGFWILDSGFCILVSRFWIPDSGFWTFRRIIIAL
ncbi:Protein CBG21607 [Caenorhabditis briggsae]|uniref:Protein CBG21607 n=1 Tax=Caenorhabditis briggsae TaxID=6238 RepID=A8Y071_CAEBR|nr:Protein CBG21607 [Caenorhabditis briggsae]CAP38361.1 Protein CBG21607 [Caenorhabditis briggsae]